ncbi:MAG: hypothetical protein AAGJ18_21715, partial [Bacteroidota bacterium]
TLVINEEVKRNLKTFSVIKDVSSKSSLLRLFSFRIFLFRKLSKTKRLINRKGEKLQLFKFSVSFLKSTEKLLLKPFIFLGISNDMMSIG